MNNTNNFYINNLRVMVFDTRQNMERTAADDAAARIEELHKIRQEINIIFAAAPSQSGFLDFLAKHDEIQWNRIHAFHMDEYIGLPREASQGFGNFLQRQIFGKVNFNSVNYLRGDAQDISDECKRYAELLKKHPPDIIFMGIGENGHIAFNDPHVALFNDKQMVKIVELDRKCRQQQVNDGCFSTIEKVPSHALTLTIPALMAGKYIFCIVPGKTKAEAVYHTVTGEIREKCPATILRRYENAVLYLDTDSAARIS